jgi:hypothetical protein
MQTQLSKDKESKIILTRLQAYRDISKKKMYE